MKKRKNIIYSILLMLVGGVMMLMSCTEGREAGDLWGQWKSTDMEDMYISFSGEVVLLHQANARNVYGKFQHVGDSLFISCVSPYAMKNDTVFVEDAFGMKPFENIRLRIKQLEGKNLVLEQGSKTWSFVYY